MAPITPPYQDDANPTRTAVRSAVINVPDDFLSIPGGADQASIRREEHEEREQQRLSQRDASKSAPRIPPPPIPGTDETTWVASLTAPRIPPPPIPDTAASAIVHESAIAGETMTAETLDMDDDMAQRIARDKAADAWWNEDNAVMELNDGMSASSVSGTVNSWVMCELEEAKKARDEANDGLKN